MARLSVPKYPTVPVGTYTGALLGKSLSKQLGVAEATGGDIAQAIRGSLLQTGVATGKVNPGTLDAGDAALLAQTDQASTIPKLKVPHTGGGGILHILGIPVKIATNTIGQLVDAAGSFPAGIYALGQATSKTVADIVPGGHTKAGPKLPDVGKALATSTVHDFTHFDPMHPLYPILDVAALASGGASALARGGGALSRLSAAGEAARAGEGGSLTARTLGKTSLVQHLGPTGAKLARIGKLERTPVPIYPQSLAHAAEGTEVPAIQLYHSASPFRNVFLERPIDRFFGSGLATRPLDELPGLGSLPAGRSLADFRTNYLLRRGHNVVRGRASSGSIHSTVQATQGFNHAMKDLLSESANQTSASEKFDALVLSRMLGAEHLPTEAQKLERLDQYREQVLTGNHPVEGIPNRIEDKRIRDLRMTLTGSKDYRRVFATPTPAMENVAKEWDKAIYEGLKTLNMDPRELLQMALGPAAHVRGLSPEEVLREQPSDIQQSMNFAIQSKIAEEGILKNGAEAPEIHLRRMIAKLMPGTHFEGAKLSVVDDAMESLIAEREGHFTRQQLMANAPNTGYLQGNTLAQKIATGMHDRLGVAPEVAERFAVGGLSNYFPAMNAVDMGMKVRRVQTEGLISRRMRALTRREAPAGQRYHLSEYRRESTSRLVTSNSLGVAPLGNFLRDVDNTAFKAGIDRRDPTALIRHISQRERMLVHSKLANPMIVRMALKGTNGEPLEFAGQAALENALGSKAMASKWRLLSPNLMRVMFHSEDETALAIADALKSGGADVTPETMDHLEHVIDETAHQFVRDAQDMATKQKGMYAVPVSFYDNLIKHARVFDQAKGPGHLWQAFISKWRSAVLSYMPAWFFRTTIGHGFVLFLSGVWNPRHYIQAMSYFGDGFKLPGTDVHLARDEAREVPLGVQQGIPHADLGHTSQRQSLHLSWLANKTTTGVHRVNNFQRRAGFLAALEKRFKQHLAEAQEVMKVPRGFHDARNIDDVIQNHPELVHQALNDLDRMSYSFGQMSPWERRLAKNLIPFWGWYKFITKTVWSLPLNFPGRAAAVSKLGQLGEAEQDKLGPMPDWLRASIMFDTHNLAGVHYLSMLGLNPLGDVANPAEGFNGLIRLGQMSPVIQAGLQAYGYNTLTGGLEGADPAQGIEEINGKYVNTKTGKEYDSIGQASVAADVERFFGGLLRSFPQVRIGEQIYTGGKPTYPESIPFINERPIPIDPSKAKNVSPLQTLLQYVGFPPKTYDLQTYQRHLIQDLHRAVSLQRKYINKEKLAK